MEGRELTICQFLQEHVRCTVESISNTRFRMVTDIRSNRTKTFLCKANGGACN